MVISQIMGFKILFGFREGLIPSSLYPFNVKTDTVKVLLKPDQRYQKKNEK